MFPFFIKHKPGVTMPRGCYVIALFLLPACGPLVAQHWNQFAGSTRDFWVTAPNETFLPTAAPSLGWTRTLGEGRGQVVTDGKTLFVTFLKPRGKSPVDESGSGVPRQRVHVTAALDASSGVERWRKEISQTHREDQQTFGGRARSPSATPLLFASARPSSSSSSNALGPHYSLLVDLSFDGQLTARDPVDGRLIWRRDLMQSETTPAVDFGFSSSPIQVGQQIIVLAGGNELGLISLNPTDGSIRWRIGCGEASYATPVVANIGGVSQIIAISRDEVFAVTSAGNRLWNHPLSNPGQTNVPTPLIVKDGLVISGQGVGGTQRLRVRRSADNTSAWKVEEAWFSDTQFFYCNWLRYRNIILGTPDQLLMALDVDTGRRLGRWRGYENANLVRTSAGILVAHGSDQISLLSPNNQPSGAAELESVGVWKVSQGRCWTPPTLVGNRLFLRRGDTLQCVNWNDDQSNLTLLKKQKPLGKLTMNVSSRQTTATNQPSPPADAVATVIAAFQSKGPQAAIEEYQSLRGQPGALDLAARMQLQSLAAQNGLETFAMQIPGHAVEDLSSKAADAWLRKTKPIFDSDQPMRHRAESGLVYVQLAIVNPGKRLDAEIRGPAKHPFGYGLPFPTGRIRIEQWPVGSVLRDSLDRSRLFTVRESDAGQLIILGDRRD